MKKRLQEIDAQLKSIEHEKNKINYRLRNLGNKENLLTNEQNYLNYLGRSKDVEELASLGFMLGE